MFAASVPMLVVSAQADEPAVGCGEALTDPTYAVFDSASRAVRCGLGMIRAARDMGVAIRVGVHTGEVEFVGDDARGVAVHAAARVLSYAGADEVLVSSTTRDLLEGSGLIFEDAGSHDLKGLSGSRSLYRVAAPATSTA